MRLRQTERQQKIQALLVPDAGPHRAGAADPPLRVPVPGVGHGAARDRRPSLGQCHRRHIPPVVTGPGQHLPHRRGRSTAGRRGDTQRALRPYRPPGPSRGASPARSRQLFGQLHSLAAQQHTNDLHQLLLYSAVALAIMAMVSIGLGWLIAGRVLRPLRTITNAARDISASNLHERLDLHGPQDEVKELGDTIDGLLERLEVAFQSQRQFVANASHELRTPLATMRASLDVALAKPEPTPQPTVVLASRLRHELDQIDRLLNGFLDLARSRGAAGGQGVGRVRRLPGGKGVGTARSPGLGHGAAGRGGGLPERVRRR